MRGKENFYRQLLRRDTLSEALPNVPVAELADDQRILIENHLGVTEYGTERIGVRVRFGCLYIYGSNLSLSTMNAHQIVIYGNIDSILLQRGTHRKRED